MSYQQVDEIGQGRVWTGENALKLGLVDMLGNLNDAIEIAKEMGGLDHYRVIKLPIKKDPFEEIIKSFSAQMEYKILEKNLGEGMKYYKTLESLKNINGVQARLPYEFEVN
jgi:protease-4